MDCGYNSLYGIMDILERAGIVTYSEDFARVSVLYFKYQDL